MADGSRIDLGLTGKHVFVVGVGGGIGGACVRAFAAAGALVSCFDIDPGAAADAAGAIGEQGRAFTGDACRLGDLRTSLDAATLELGALEVGVDVIGETRWGRTIELDDETWDESFDLVLRHFFNLARVAGRDLSEHGRGSLI